MKLAVFGEGTALGYGFMRRLLHHGFMTGVLVDSSTSFPLKHKNLSITEGSLSSQADIIRLMQTSHAVVCLLDIYYDAATTNKIIHGMKVSGLRRLLVVTHLSHLQATDELQLSSLLQRTSLDWTIIHSVGIGEEINQQTKLPHDFLLSINDFSKFIIDQITDVTHLHSAVMLKN